MLTQTRQAMRKSLDTPDEVRQFNNGKVEIVNLEGVTVGRATFQPGWRWSKDVKPIAGTESCLFSHHIYVLAGRMTIQMDDGLRIELRPGDSAVIPAGHDAWVDGQEPCELIDFSGLEHYAREHQEATPVPGEYDFID